MAVAGGYNRVQEVLKTGYILMSFIKMTLGREWVNSLRLHILFLREIQLQCPVSAYACFLGKGLKTICSDVKVLGADETLQKKLSKKMENKVCGCWRSKVKRH